jgi:hypothetical protein
MFLLIAALTSVFLFVLCKVKFSRRDAAFATFPRPPRIPFFHNLFLVLGEAARNPLETASRVQSELGEVFLITSSIIDSGIVIVADPVVAEAVLLHQPERSRSLFYESIAQWIGKDGYFLSPEKREQKKIKIFIKFLNSGAISRVRIFGLKLNSESLFRYFRVLVTSTSSWMFLSKLCKASQSHLMCLSGHTSLRLIWCSVRRFVAHYLSLQQTENSSFQKYFTILT